MDRVPIIWNGAAAGELTLEREGLYTRFTARCWVQEGLWCVWVIGDRGELRLGVLEPSESGFGIRRRCSGQVTGPLGTVLRGEIRAVPSGNETEWRQLSAAEAQTPWLRKRIHRCDVWLRQEGGRTFLAVPYDPKEPFPLLPLVCFACVRTVRGQTCAVFAFDSGGRPVFL